MTNCNSPFPGYHHFGRDSWAGLRDSVPLTLNESDLIALQGINEKLSMEEVAKIYLPLSRLINLYVKSKQRRGQVQAQFLGTEQSRAPYVIGICGSVAVGKSTTARILQALLERWSEHPSVALVTTDGFLYPNGVLEQRGIMNRKGFPESYDTNALIRFLKQAREGKASVDAPVYSHEAYDIVPDQFQQVRQPDILLLEGLNVLQSARDYPTSRHSTFVSDFIDFSIYVDAKEEDLTSWYVERFLRLRDSAFKRKNAYFHHYAEISTDKAKQIALDIWNSVNRKNLLENIQPTRERADLILKKGMDHLVSDIYLRL